ncbi:NADPH:quinone reductase [Stieleria varia]|uniref:Quinone oxidoreductase 1 n=1 Tax=Stieleria varia TaxID=2528005 RepID=A0A5C6ARY8_9BACT|nr:NADPH:quinone reductase [Stieleria varia]TWU02348.1 Quinone oxidoreductase 1 [Stieleria varia]
MKAAFIEQTGSPDVIRFDDLPEPKPGADQVVIRNHAVCVNPIDTYVRGGLVAGELPMPYILGCDAAGVVESVGANVTEFRTGDRVWCSNQGLLGRQGTFAEKIAVDAHWCYPIPNNVEFTTAAACALVGITAHLGLFQFAKLVANETLLVIGGTGGVGSMVVQMAKAAGATVITTAGSDEKCALATKLGADTVIHYRNQSIADAASQAAPDGVNVFWETRRSPDFDMAVQLLAPRGRMIVMAGRDARPEFPVGPFYVKECSLHGFVMFKASPDEMRVAADDINRWLSDGKLVANIDRVMPLSEAAAAHRIQQAATVEGTETLQGKIVLTVD